MNRLFGKQLGNTQAQGISPRHRRSLYAIFTLCVLALTSLAFSENAVPLIDPAQPTTGWKFSTGQEFPGAKGEFTAADASHTHEGHATLHISGDFTHGGNYVAAGRPIDSVDIRELSLWVRNPSADNFTLRINDATGQTHQIALRVPASDDWQRIALPLEKFFAKRGEADAVTCIAKYESWGGAKDGQWHGPASAIYVVVGKTEKVKQRELWLSDLSIVPRPAEVAGAGLSKDIRLDEMEDGQHEWRFSLGQEFKGAKGSLTVVKDLPTPGQSCLQLEGDFTGGGAYVAMIRNLKELGAKEVRRIRCQLKSDHAETITLQLVDGAGQTHQRRGTKIIADGQWHEFVIEPATLEGAEHWGGPNDGHWHGAPSQLAISVTADSDKANKHPVIDLADMHVEAILPVFAQPAAFHPDFHGLSNLPSDWKATPSVTLDTKTTFEGNPAIVLSRTVNEAESPCAVTSPNFPASPGQWQIRLACQSRLHSPDSSYNAVVTVEALGAAGQVIQSSEIADVFGTRNWQKIQKIIDAPNGTAAMRVHAQLNKAWDNFAFTDVSAAYLAPSPRKDDRLTRMLFTTARLGNLLLPEDSRVVKIEVESRKPLRELQRTVHYVVQDYWGAEQTSPAPITLSNSTKAGDHFTSSASLDLSSAPLEVGKYYEIHASIAPENEEPFRGETSLAILPEAVTKSYPAEEIPFTSRNWDNRIKEYVELTDRLGIRICGLWGGWSAKPPYTPEAPSLDLCQKLGMGWLSNTPCAEIERGKTNYSEEALRQGVRNLIEKYGKVRPFIINLGNEPHGAGQRVLNNVAAYRTVYEEVKKVDPTIPVVATSVEPNEEYFRAGYGQWCDAYDFHIYESSEDVRRTLGEYQALAAKYHQVKPIWSTELGLNSQGMTRHTVAKEVIKKFATFFAAGGSHVSWFGLLYPDPNGTEHGKSGDSHNVFDCRYNHYAPRLDAVAYYNGVNAIAIKKFTEERHYANGVDAILFHDKDNKNLLVLWEDKGRDDVSLPISGDGAVQMIRIDGRRRTLKPNHHKIFVSVNEDPLMLLFDGPVEKLPETLAPAPIRWSSLHNGLSRHKATYLRIDEDRAVGLLHWQAPPLWKASDLASGYALYVGPKGAYDQPFHSQTFQPPSGSSIREAEFTVSAASGEGEIYLRVPMKDE